MVKIGLISDTHGYMHEDITKHLTDVDEIWHAGDVGPRVVLDELEKLNKPIRGVYGNIDAADIRREFPLNQHFTIEGIKVYMTHIGGYPGKMYKRVIAEVKKEKPNLYICGHSHICKVMPDKKNVLLHMNPGACGHIGFHKMRTILLFEINKGKIENLRVVELGIRGRVDKDWESTGSSLADPRIRK
jgi:putative phosphoesterase